MDLAATRTATSRRPGATSAAASSTATIRAGRRAATRSNIPSLADFARALPKIRERIDADLRRRALPRERVVASIVWLLDNTMIRVGNAVYARDNKSFGLTTLKTRHVEVEGSKLRFAFKGKSGKEWKLKLVDRRMAKIMRSIQELPGQHLFQYHRRRRRAARGALAGRQRLYPRRGGGDFSSKHFRTWGGTVRALALFAEPAVARHESRRRPRHERRHRRGGAASRQHARRLPQMLHPS